MNQRLYNELLEIVTKEQIKIEEPMRSHTTFRVGGPADLFLMPRTPDEVKGIVELLNKESVPYYILGNGSNLLVSDQGYRGVIVQIYKEMNRIEIEGDVVKAHS